LVVRGVGSADRPEYRESRERRPTPSGRARLALPGSTADAVAGAAVPAAVEASAAGVDVAGAAAVDVSDEFVDRLVDPAASMSGSKPERACSLPPSGDASPRTPAVSGSTIGAVLSIGAAASTTGAAACVTGAVVCATGVT